MRSVHHTLYILTIATPKCTAPEGKPPPAQSTICSNTVYFGKLTLVGADVLTLHAGSSAGGLPDALERLERGIELLDGPARERLALENDDRRFAPASLLPLCERLGVPLVYDVHHHRCNPDALDVTEATERAAATWRGREPHFHISSPRAGWGGGDTRPHADYVTADDFPDAWRSRRLTIDVEAKAKERAVMALRDTVRVAHIPA